MPRPAWLGTARAAAARAGCALAQARFVRTTPNRYRFEAQPPGRAQPWPWGPMCWWAPQWRALLGWAGWPHPCGPGPCAPVAPPVQAVQVLQTYLDVFTHHYLQAKHQLPPHWQGEAHQRLAQALGRTTRA